MPALASTEVQPQLRPAIRPESKQLRLTEALDMGLARNPRTQAARAQLGITESNLVQANVLPNPGVFIDNQYQFTYKLGATMLVEPPWRIIFRRAAAKAQISQTDLEITRVLWLFRGEVRRAYIDALIAREMAAIRKQLLDILKRLLSIAQDRFSNGDVARLDVHRAELAVIQAEIQLQQAEIVVTQTKEQLNVLLDQPSPSAEPVSFSIAANELIETSRKLNSKEELLDTAYKNRLELKIVSQQIKVNREVLRVARGNILPAPRFNVGGMTEDRINSPFNRRTVFFQAMIDVPILDRQQGFIARAHATNKQLSCELSSQQNLITQQVLLAFRKMQTALANAERYANSALPVSKNISTAADLSYRIGQTDINSALVAQQENILVQTQYLDSLLALQIAMNDLEQAVGIPLQ